MGSYTRPVTGDPSSSAPVTTRPRLAPLGPLVALVSAAVFTAHGFLGTLDRDLAIYTYAGQRVADGVPPYLGIVNRSGPLSHLAPGLGVWVARQVGLDDLTGARVLFLLISVAGVYAAYRLGRSMLGSSVLGAAVGLTLVCVQGYVEYASRGPREKTLMVLLLLLALHAVLRRRWLLVGLATSLATLTWQPVFFSAVVVALAGLLLERRGRRLRGLGWLSLGGLVPLVGFVVWYAALGHLQDFLDCFVLIHVKYTTQDSALSDPSRWARDLQSAYGPSLWVLLLGLLAAVVAGVVGTRRMVSRKRTLRTDEQRGADAFAVALALGTVSAVAWTLRAYNGWPDAYVLFPFAVAGIAWVAALLRAVVRRRAALVLAVAWSVAATTLGATYAVDSREDGVVAQTRRAEAIMTLLGPDATMLSLQAPAPLVLTGHVDPTKHQMFSLGLERYVDDVWPGGLEGFADWVLDERPTVITVAATFHPDWAEQLLAQGYTRIGYDEEGAFSWWVSDEVDDRTRAQAMHVIYGDTSGDGS